VFPTRRAALATACALTIGLGLAACGSDDGDTTETGAPPAEGNETAASQPEAPERIVSLSPTATEMLFAIGAGDQVVAVDDQSDFPEGVPTSDLSGYEPNLEAIIAYEPDLVVADFLADDIVSGLESVDAEVLLLPAAAVLDDTYAQLADLGVATGHEDEAAEVVAGIRADIDEIVAGVPERDEAPTYYHELDDTLYSVTSSTFIGQLYELAGLANVADAADPDGAFGGYPQLSAEFLVTADPDFVFLADTECCGQDASTLAARPGFGNLQAVTAGRVVELSDDVASRWGPRVVDLLRTIVEATADFTADAPAR
jgi:iron complex transport system substrate-binding protein